MSRLVGAVLVVGLAVVLASCGSTSGSTGASGEDDTSSPTSGASRSSSGAADVRTTPDGCELPVLELAAPATVRLLYARADESTVPGVTFTLRTATPGGDQVALEITRTAQGCTGTARLTVVPDEHVSVLGMDVVSSAPRGLDPVPNRASVVLTVQGGAR